MNPLLSDPWWSGLPPVCISCAYDLHGLTAPCHCPECGREYDEHSLMLTGIARALTTSAPLRRAAWIAIIVIGGIGTQVAPYLGVKSITVMLGLYLTPLAGLTALFATSRRERSSAERFVITPAGLTREPIEGSHADRPSDSAFVPFAGLTTARLDRVGPFWRRLRLGIVNDRTGRLREVAFDAGIRCLDEHAPEVQSTLDCYIARSNAGAPRDSESGRDPHTWANDH